LQWLLGHMFLLCLDSAAELFLDVYRTPEEFNAFKSVSKLICVVNSSWR
jgi:hypothetical protein